MTARPRLPASIEETRERLLHESYVADRPLATAVFLALKLERPLFLEGQPGTGKTEIAKVLAHGLGTELIRLQCYEGLDVNLAAYEWNYARQMLRSASAKRRTNRASTLPRACSPSVSSLHVHCCARCSRTPYRPCC